MQLGFQSVSVDGKIVQKKQLFTLGETVHKTMKKHRTHKLERKTYKTRKQA